MDVKITDNSDKFKSAMRSAKLRALEAIGLQVESYAKSACPVDTGLLRNSITHAVSGQSPAISSYKADRGEGRGSYNGSAPNDTIPAVYVGSNVEYATYVENGGAKKGPRPFLKPAATDHTVEYKEIAKKYLQDG